MAGIHTLGGRPRRLALFAGLLLEVALSLAVTRAPGLAAPPPNQADATITANDARAREGKLGGVSAIYLTLANTGDTDDTLTGAVTEVAGVTEIHQTTMQAGVMRMNPAGPLTIPAGGSVTFQPGGLHVMLIDLQRDLVAGEEFAATLTFERAGELPITVTVR